MTDLADPQLQAAIAGREIAEGPFSDEEYDLLLLWRRTGFRPTTDEERARFDMLTLRFFTQMRQTHETDTAHEAGHIVVGDVLGYPTLLTYRQADGTPSVAMDRITQEPPPFQSEAQFLADIHDWARIRVAGYLAERRVMGRSDPAESTRIVRRVEQFLGYAPDQQIAYLEAIEAETSAILDAHWDAVERVAHMLNDNIDRKMAEIRAAIDGTG